MIFANLICHVNEKEILMVNTRLTPKISSFFGTKKIYIYRSAFNDLYTLIYYA